MSSINNGVDFIYGRISSQEIGLKIASSFGSTSRSGNVETRDVIISNTPSGKIFGFHGVKYTSPNSFDLIMYKEDGTFIDEYQERQLKKILMSSNPQWLNIDQDTLSNISYFCIGTKLQLLDVGMYTGGILVSFQMDSIGAWTNLNTKTYTTSNGVLSYKINMITDYDDEIIKPIITITTTTAGDISIKNVTKNETTLITGCASGEVIILDGSSGKISTSANGVLLDRWNKRYLKLQDGGNDILLTGNFIMKLQYRQMVRVGG